MSATDATKTTNATNTANLTNVLNVTNITSSEGGSAEGSGGGGGGLRIPWNFGNKSVCCTLSVSQHGMSFVKSLSKLNP